jgi:hypothetical protein
MRTTLILLVLTSLALISIGCDKTIREARAPIATQR